MIWRIFLGLMLVLSLTSCGLLASNSGAPVETAIPGAPRPGAMGGKQSGDLNIWIYSDPTPPIRGNAQFEAILTDKSGKPVNDAKLSFDIDMTNMSHGKNVVAATSLGDGRYGGRLSFMMPGPWRVIVGIERGGQTSSVRFDFNVNVR